LLSTSTPVSLEHDLHATALPFLADLSFEERAAVLQAIFEAEGRLRLSWVEEFARLEADTPRAFPSASLAGACCAAAYACEAVDAWKELFSLLQSAKKALQLDRGFDNGRAAAQVRLVEGHVAAAQLLTKNGLPTAVAAVRDADAAAAERMVRTLLARAARASGRGGEGRWIELWADLEQAREQGLNAAISEETLQAEMCRALLRCGQLRLAESYLSKLPASRAEELVVSAARDAFLSSPTADAAAARQAKDCLALLPNSVAATEEARFVDAARRLAALGVSLPPMQMRQASSKAELMTMILESCPNLARDPGTLLQLADALGAGAERPKLLARVAQEALDRGDFAAAEAASEEVVKEQYRRVTCFRGFMCCTALQSYHIHSFIQLHVYNHRCSLFAVAVAVTVAVAVGKRTPRVLIYLHHVSMCSEGWPTVARIANDPRCSGLRLRQDLFSFCLRHAPVKELLPLLESWKATDDAQNNAEGGAAWAAPDSREPEAAHVHFPHRHLRSYFFAFRPVEETEEHRYTSVDAEEGFHRARRCNPQAAVALSSLLALGSQAEEVWTGLLEEYQGGLALHELQQAMEVGLTAYALLVCILPSLFFARLPYKCCFIYVQRKPTLQFEYFCTKKYVVCIICLFVAGMLAGAASSAVHIGRPCRGGSSSKAALFCTSRPAPGRGRCRTYATSCPGFQGRLLGRRQQHPLRSSLRERFRYGRGHCRHCVQGCAACCRIGLCHGG
jgi:hypothetical protein